MFHSTRALIISSAERGMSDTRLECRFYEEPFPEVESLVMVNVRNIAEMGAYVTLLEYNNIEGMILLSAVSYTHLTLPTKRIL